jgi:hypothetical protein
MLEGTDAGKGKCRKGEMLERVDARKGKCQKGWMPERANAGEGSCWKERMSERADARSSSFFQSPDSKGDLRQENCLAVVHKFFTGCFRAPTVRWISDKRYAS